MFQLLPSLVTQNCLISKGTLGVKVRQMLWTEGILSKAYIKRDIFVLEIFKIGLKTENPLCINLQVEAFGHFSFQSLYLGVASCFRSVRNHSLWLEGKGVDFLPAIGAAHFSPCALNRLWGGLWHSKEGLGARWPCHPVAPLLLEAYRTKRGAGKEGRGAAFSLRAAVNSCCSSAHQVCWVPRKRRRVLKWRVVLKLAAALDGSSGVPSSGTMFATAAPPSLCPWQGPT